LFAHRVVASTNDASPRINVVDSRIYTGGSSGGGGAGGVTATPSAPPAPAQTARVLYDYDAADMTELSLAADEVGF